MGPKFLEDQKRRERILKDAGLREDMTLAFTDLPGVYSGGTEAQAEAGTGILVIDGCETKYCGVAITFCKS